MPWTPSDNPAVCERWRQRVEAQLASGLSVQAFARQHRFGAESLYRWRSWFRQQRAAGPQLPALVEVRVEEALPPPAIATMCVELTSGRRVVLEPGFDTNAVARLVAVLERV